MPTFAESTVEEAALAWLDALGYSVGVLKPSPTATRSRRDYVFASPSTAAGVVLGPSSNGSVEWQTKDGRSLKAQQEAEASGRRVRLASRLTHMHPLIAAHRTEIEALCRRFHVKRLEAFGSIVRDDFDPERSDADFLVELDKEASESLFSDYMDLKFALEDLLGRSVDLVMPDAITNPYFRAAIQADRTLLFAA